MFKVKENDIFEKNMSKSELYQTTKMSQNNSTKLVSEYDKVSFDKWMESLITRNGITKY
jgi:DNA-binding Xre family transcriptional regulator